MFHTRMRKILRDVSARKGRTILVSLAIFVGVAGTITLFSMSDIIVSQLEKDIQQDKLSMLDFYVTTNIGSAINNEAYLQALNAIPGTTDVMGAVVVPVQFAVEPDNAAFEEGSFTAYSIPFEAAPPIEPVRLLEGGRYPIQGANEIIIEQRLAEAYQLEAGDSLYLKVLSPSRSSGITGTVEEWTITGIVFHPYSGILSYGPNVAPQTSIYGEIADANYVSGVTGYNVFRARFEDYPTAEKMSEAFGDFIVNETPYIPQMIISTDPAKNSLIQNAQTMGSTMSALAFIALLVSGFLVFNVIMSVVVEQRRQIGVMKTLGATRLDNFRIYTGLALAYGVIGVIPGVLVGVPGGNAAAHALAPQLNTILEGFLFSPSSVVLGIMVGLLIPVLASLLPVVFGTRVQILDAITDRGINARYGTGPVARLVGSLPLPISIRQGISNASLKKSRLVFTVITLATAAGAFMGIYALFASLSDGIAVMLNTFNVEIALVPSEARQADELVSILKENFQTGETSLLASIEPGFVLQVEFEGYEPLPSMMSNRPGVSAYGYDSESETPAMNVVVDRGEPLTADNAANGIIFSSLLAANMNKQVGDTVTMNVPGNRVELVIVGISDYPMEQVWLDWRTLAIITHYTTSAPVANTDSPTTTQSPTSAETLEPHGEPLPQGYYLTTTLDDPTADEVNTVMEQVDQVLQRRGISAYSINYITLVDQINQMFAVIPIILEMAAGLIALVGALGLWTTLSMSVFERQKEIGIMRCIGASSSTIVAQFLSEGMVVGLIAWALGLPLAALLAWLLLDVTGFGATFPFVFPMEAALFGLIGLFAVTILASVWPSLSAARKTVSDILRYQ